MFRVYRVTFDEDIPNGATHPVNWHHSSAAYLPETLKMSIKL